MLLRHTHTHTHKARNREERRICVYLWRLGHSVNNNRFRYCIKIIRVRVLASSFFSLYCLLSFYRIVVAGRTSEVLASTDFLDCILNHDVKSGPMDVVRCSTYLRHSHPRFLLSFRLSTSARQTTNISKLPRMETSLSLR